MKLAIQYIFVGALISLGLSSCQQAGGDNPGSEFMPDMAHSVAYEANVYSYYYNNTWGTEDEYYERAKPGLPVAGTIPRSMNDASGIKITPAGTVPYHYANSEEGRAEAMAEIINNPLPITDKGIAVGKELYMINCGICHGDKGDGGGYLVRDADPAKGVVAGKYPVQPANFLLDEFVTASNGRYYHSIMHGRNLMGSYADKLGYEERWNVIHYIRSLQAKDKKLVYSQLENTFNNTAIPASEIVVKMVVDHGVHMEGTEGGHHGNAHEGHGAHDAHGQDDHGDGHDHKKDHH